MSGCNGNCGCAHCTGSIGIGSYAPVLPFGQTGYRLSIPGGPVGGQFHGRPSANLDAGTASIRPAPPHKQVYRSSAELPPRPNAGGAQNILRVRHSQRKPGYSMVPGGLYAAPTLGALPVVTPPSHPGYFGRGPCPAWGCGGPVRAFPPDTTIPSPSQPGTTNVAPMPAPGSITAPAPTVNTPCPAGQYQDAAGNCTDDWHNPYPLYLPAQPSPVVSASTVSTPTAGQPGCVSGEYDVNGNCIITSTTPGTTPSWLTDPTQELISGIPNWGLLAAGAGVLLLMGRRR